MLVPLMNDQVNEPTESFIVTLMLPPGQPGAQLGGDTATLTVMDDDGRHLNSQLLIIGQLISG